MGGIDLHKLQERAIEDASPRVGAYLDRIGKTELSEMSGAEWLAFLAAVVAEYGVSMRKLSVPSI